MSQPTVLITGASGFIGRYIVRHFVKSQWAVIGVSSTPPENAPSGSLIRHHQLRLPSSKFPDLLRTYAPDLCIHCAGRAAPELSVQEPLSDYQNNAVLTFEVLNALRIAAPACKLILLSSAAVYGNPPSLPISEIQPAAPISPYGFHKWQCEQMCQEFTKIYGLQTATLRIFSAYGPGLRRQVLWDICQKALLEPTVELLGTGQESRDLIHARDIARAIDIVATKGPLSGEIYNLGSGQEITIADLAQQLLDLLDYSQPPIFSGGLPPGIPRNWCADITKISQLGFSPILNLHESLPRLVQWCRAEIQG
ncbi:MAG: SDR family oxidoreductase [Cyanobacteria bacterium P01_H01_bin.15]